MNYIVKHPTLRNVGVIIQCPPKAVKGRWKCIRVVVNNDGVGKIDKVAWEKELQVAQEAGLVENPFLIIGEDNTPGVNRGVGPLGPGDPLPVGSELYGIMEHPQGARTINQHQYAEILKESKSTNRSKTRWHDRPKGWT